MSPEYVWFILFQRSICDNLHVPPHTHRAITFLPSSAPWTLCHCTQPAWTTILFMDLGPTCLLCLHPAVRKNGSLSGFTDDCLPEHHLSSDINVTSNPEYIHSLLSNAHLIQLRNVTLQHLLPTVCCVGIGFFSLLCLNLISCLSAVLASLSPNLIALILNSDWDTNACFFRDCTHFKISPKF